MYDKYWDFDAYCQEVWGLTETIHVLIQELHSDLANFRIDSGTYSQRMETLRQMSADTRREIGNRYAFKDRDVPPKPKQEKED